MLHLLKLNTDFHFMVFSRPPLLLGYQVYLLLLVVLDLDLILEVAQVRGVDYFMLR